MGTTLRRAHSADLPALAALRAEAFGTDEAEARGWLQNIAGLDNVLVLERGGEPLALLGAVPVDCGRRRGVWFSGMLTRPEARGRGVMKNLMSVCLRAYAQSGYDFAVTAPGASRASRALEGVGFQSAFPLRVVRRPVQRSILAQASFDALTVRRLLDARLHYQPACVQLPEPAMAEMVTRLYRRGMTIVSNPRGYGLYFLQGDTLHVLELQADNDHCADVLLQAAREKTGAVRASILLAENQTLYLGAGKRCGYGMVCFLKERFPVTDVYFRLLE